MPSTTAPNAISMVHFLRHAALTSRDEPVEYKAVTLQLQHARKRILVAEADEHDTVRRHSRHGVKVDIDVDECQKVQQLRNDIIHKGTKCQFEDANHGAVVAGAVFQQIVVSMLGALGLTVVEKGRIERSKLAQA
ncbi:MULTISPECIES: hypothetical protein [unclassified Cupriavidus]|uniref:hypothetical protein n=1 Tax=unclassified Cupriavidus TaxID=2640874 RepID=UPI00313C4A62